MQRSSSSSTVARSGPVPRRIAMGWAAVIYRAWSGATTPSRPPIRRTMRSSCSTSIVSPGLDDGARAARVERLRAAPTTTRDRTSRRPSRPSRPGRSGRRPPSPRSRSRRAAGSPRTPAGGWTACRPSARATGAAPCSGSSAARIARRRHRKMPGVPGDARPSRPAPRPGPAWASPRSGQRVGLQAAHVLAAVEVRDEVAVFGRRAVDLDAEGDQRILDAEGPRREAVGGRPQHLLEDADVLDGLVGRAGRP